MGWIVGTLILWGLKAISVPFARTLAGRNASDSEGGVDEIPVRHYVLADVTVLGIAGFLLGLLAGCFFIGVSFRARDWPGMIAFIAASLVGALLHG
ncbi:MAG: hypothetical protein QXP01_00230 [Candidatus Hadarchaeum sp.]|nr:hypothetical protein [candidate division KSB1 bacterium]